MRDRKGAMNWLALALISSITLSFRELFIKKNGKAVSPLFMSWGLNFFSFCIILLINIGCRNLHSVTPSFLIALFSATVLDSIATILYLYAIKTGDLSKTIPMLCFIPVVQLFVAPVLVQENLSLIGIIGVLIVVFGSYVLNLDRWDNLLSPIKVVFKEKSTMMMLGVALLWGISSSFHKIGVRQTDALFWGAAEIGLISLLLLPLVAWSGKKDFSVTNIKSVFWPAIFSTMAVLSYYTALGLGPVAYVSSVRRLGVLFSMIFGIILFRETIKPIGFIGGVIMITGAVIITLFG